MQKANDNLSILILGADGCTGHVAVQMARACFECQHVTALCSRNNESFCYQQGATHVVTYDDINYTELALQQKLQQSPGAPFDIVLNCVASADPRDEKCNYPKRLQQLQRLSLLKDDYVYRRLGGPTLDWIRAGMERTLPCNTNWIWNNNPHEKLFWIRFPKSAPELRQLHTWMEHDGKLSPPHIERHNIFPFTKQGVENAFTAILSRRVRGKVVVQIIHDDDTDNDDNNNERH
jgi:hypothetical protein